MAVTLNASTTAGLVQTADTSGVLALQTAGTTAVTVDASQNVGIGTTTLTNKLNVAGAINSSAALSAIGASTVALSQESGFARLAAFGPNGSTAGTLYLYVIDSAGGNQKGMVIDSSGNVGVGTTSPLSTAKVTIKQASGGGTGSRQLHLEQSNTTDGYDLTCDSATGHLDFARYVSGSANTRMRLDADGNLMLGYGGISPSTVAAPQGMSLVSNSNVALQIYMLKNAQVESHIGFKSSTDTNFYVGTGGGQGAAGIGVYGVYQVNTASSWTAVSDERFKTELQPIENALDRVAGVRAVTGRYIYDEENGVTKRRPFLIAQDFLTALPEAVDTQDPEKYGLSYSDTVPLLFAAIKEQQALITQLQADVAALKGASA